jgi:hypothetical protein
VVTVPSAAVLVVVLEQSENSVTQTSTLLAFVVHVGPATIVGCGFAVVVVVVVVQCPTFATDLQ